MSLRVVTMGELRLEVLLEPEKTGRSVAEVCRRRGVSRETFYEYRRRYAKEGPPASNLGPDSPQRPRPRSTSIWRWRSAACGRIIHVGERGGSEPSFDAPVSIRQPSPPSTKCFRRNHLVTDQPSKRPKATKRFEREVPNDLWQIDATRVLLADNSEVWVVDALDDHARFLLAARAVMSPTTEAAWACFAEAATPTASPASSSGTTGCASPGVCMAGWWTSRDGSGPHGRPRDAQGPEGHHPDLSEDQIRGLLKQPDTRTWVGIRDRAILLTFLDTLVRVSELVGVNAEDVDLKARTMQVMGKGAKERELPLGKRVTQALRRYHRTLEDLESGDPLFLSRCGGRISRKSVHELVARYRRGRRSRGSGALPTHSDTPVPRGSSW